MKMCVGVCVDMCVDMRIQLVCEHTTRRDITIPNRLDLGHATHLCILIFRLNGESDS